MAQRLLILMANIVCKLWIGYAIEFVNTSQLVYAAPEGTAIEQIAIGEDYMGMITNDETDQHLYTWGQNVFGNLGYDTNIFPVYSPREGRHF